MKDNTLQAMWVELMHKKCSFSRGICNQSVMISNNLALPIMTLQVNTTYCGKDDITLGNIICNAGTHSFLCTDNIFMLSVQN